MSPADPTSARRATRAQREVIAELDRTILERQTPLPASELRSLWILLKTAVGAGPTPREIEKQAAQKAKSLRTYLRHADPDDKPDRLSGNQCGLTITVNRKLTKPARHFAANFSVTRELAGLLGWEAGQRIEVKPSNGLWLLSPGPAGWCLASRGPRSLALNLKISVSMLRFASRITKPHAQRACEHEIRGRDLLLCPPTWGEPQR